MSKITNDGLAQDAYNCTHMATAGVNQLTPSAAKAPLSNGRLLKVTKNDTCFSAHFRFLQQHNLFHQFILKLLNCRRICLSNSDEIPNSHKRITPSRSSTNRGLHMVVTDLMLYILKSETTY